MAFNSPGEGRNIKLAKFLRPDEVYRMFEKAKQYSTRDFKILMLLYYFGLRNSEMTSLRKEDIDIAQKTLKVVQGKGSKDRIVPIVEFNPFWHKDRKTVLDYLAEWKGGKDDKGFIIQGDSQDGSLSERTVRRVVKRYAKLAKVENADEVHPHTLRHSYATHLVNMGVPESIIQRLLGHSSLSTTQIYAHMGVENLRKEVHKAVNTIEFKRKLPAKIDEIGKIDNDNERILAYQKLIIEAVSILLGV